jgi:hypothetical protein
MSSAAEQLAAWVHGVPFTFDEASHIYAVNGMPVPNVTRMLQGAGIISFEHVPPDVLRRKQLLGKLVHQACHFYDENDLPERLPQEVAVRLEAYKKFRSESGYKPMRNEGRMVAVVHGMSYGMQFDSIGPLNGLPTIVDLKTGVAVEPGWGVQTAGYELGIPKPLPHPRYQRVVVQLKDDGNYKVHTYADPTDAQIFLACLAIATWKQNKRIN